MRALVMSGGGEKGGYQAGACSYLINELYREYELLCGVSVGAINAAFLSQSLDADMLVDMWMETKTRDVMRHHYPFFWLSGFFRGSLYNTKPLRKTIERCFDPANITRKLRVGAVSLTSGEYRVFTEEDADIFDGIMASSAHPVAMDLIKARDERWSDGGVRNVTPLRAAIEAGATDIDVIMVSPAGGPGKWDKKKPNLLQRSLRELSIVLDEASDDDLKVCEWVNVAVKRNAPEARDKRLVRLNVIRPSSPLDSDTLKFVPAKTKVMIERGYADAKRLVLT